MRMFIGFAIGWFLCLSLDNNYTPKPPEVIEHVNICEAINMQAVSASCKVYNDGEQECTYECWPEDFEGEFVL